MPDLSALLDEARAEAKRRGHGPVTVAHLAVAVQHRYPEAVVDAWGSVLPAALRSLEAIPVTYDSPTPQPSVLGLEPLLRAGDMPALVEAIGTAVLASAPQPPVQASDDPITDDPAAPADPSAYAVPEAHQAWARVIDPDESIIGREAVVEAMLDALDRRRPAPVLLVGEEGSGRTAMAAALAGAVAERGLAVVRIDNAAAPADRQLAALTELLRLSGGKAVVFIDDLEIALGLGFPAGVSSNYLTALRPALEDPSMRIVAVITTPYLARLQGTDRELVDEFTTVSLLPLPPDVLHRVVTERSAHIAEYHGVSIPTETIATALGPAQAGDLGTHPALALRRLDVAATRAARRARRTDFKDVVTRTEDVPITVAVQRRVDPTVLGAALREQIIGQDMAIDAVASRLAITVAQLDINPHRPDGVFLFAGPTGVGKTALALALARALFGTDEAVVRIDMSELHEEHTVAKLVGSPPGYIGHDDPSGWLTTQIRTMPRCVLLLDEIEKAHPQVWNTFLQVFDAGRLTDLRGASADFREVVIVMTTNIGAEVFTDTGPIGFVDNTSSAAADISTVRETLRRTMRPELLNRIDEILVFSPLSTDAVDTIARARVQDAIATLRSRGYDVESTPELIELIARIGFSREYGAREMLRTVERFILQPLAARPPGSYRPVVDDGTLTWQSQ